MQPVEVRRARPADLCSGSARVATPFLLMLDRIVHLDPQGGAKGLGAIRAEGLSFKPMETTYFLGRETIIVTRRHGMALWREKLFVLMARNAVRATTFFRREREPPPPSAPVPAASARRPPAPRRRGEKARSAPTGTGGSSRW